MDKNKEELIVKIKEVIKVKVRPMLVMDGGNIEFVDFYGDILIVRLLGACHGCPMASLTLRGTVERIINEELGTSISVQAVDFEEE